MRCEATAAACTFARNSDNNVCLLPRPRRLRSLSVRESAQPGALLALSSTLTAARVLAQR
jgi:hypothetical protein